MIKKVANVALAISIVVAVAGCASPNQRAETPTVRETETATPQPAVTVVGDHIVVDGSGLTLAAADGTAVAFVKFTDSADSARDEISKWLGLSATSSSATSTHYCSDGAATITDVWADGVTLTHTGLSTDTTGYKFGVSVVSAAVNGIAIETTGGVSVGDPASDLTAAVPSALTEAGNGVTRIYYDRPDDGFSAYAWAWERDGTKIEQIIAPYALEESC